MRLPHWLLGSDTRGTGNAAPTLRANDSISDGIADASTNSRPDAHTDTCALH